MTETIVIGALSAVLGALCFWLVWSRPKTIKLQADADLGKLHSNALREAEQVRVESDKKRNTKLEQGWKDAQKEAENAVSLDAELAVWKSVRNKLRANSRGTSSSKP